MSARIMLRPIASPLPLGFFAFAIGLVLTSALDMGALPQVQAHRVAILVLSFVAPLELLAAGFALVARDTAAGTALGLFGASWVATALSLLTAPAGAANPSLGVFQLADAGAMALLAVSAVGSKPFFSILLGLASARFVLSGLGELTGAEPLRLAASIVGWADAALAFYGALALLIEDVRHQTTLPLFRRHAARTAMVGDLGDQLRAVSREAGVREQL